jgi:F-type H+-transporting ATPase subunit c
MFARVSSPSTPAANYHWVAITAGFSMAIASAGCGLAQAKATAAASEGMGRNAGASAAIRFALLLGLVLIESLALYMLVIIFTKVKWFSGFASSALMSRGAVNGEFGSLFLGTTKPIFGIGSNCANLH